MTPTPTIDSVRDELRTAIFNASYFKDGVTDPNRLEVLSQAASTFAEFGVRTGLITPDEGNEWLDAIWGRKTIQKVAESYMKEVPSHPHRMGRQEFLEGVYTQSACDDEDNVVSFIFNYMSDLFQENRYQEADAILAEVDVSRLKTFALISFLTITNSTSAKLHKRQGYYQRAWTRCVELEGRSEAKKLLGGFDKEEKKEGWGDGFMRNILGFRS